MPMTGKGIAKLIEEMGELQQVLGKRLAYYTTDDHPDGGPPLTQRMEDEMADVMAAIDLVIIRHQLDQPRVEARRLRKLRQFLEWDGLEGNNEHGIDAGALARGGEGS